MWLQKQRKQQQNNRYYVSHTNNFILILTISSKKTWTYCHDQKQNLFVDFEHIKLFNVVFRGLLWLSWHVTAIWANQIVSARLSQQLRNYQFTECMWERVCGCEIVGARTSVCVRVNLCECGCRCALIYPQNQRKFDENLWVFMDVLCSVRRILNNICSFLRWCNSFHLVYFIILLLLVQFSPGVCVVFYWCLGSFLHAHTHN